MSIEGSASKRSREPVKNNVFISYSHEDKQWLELLHKYLKPLEKKGIIERWDDTLISPGQLWREQIKSALQSTKIALFLGSVDFFNSDFIDREELSTLLGMARVNKVKIMWIAVRPCPQEHPLSPFQALNDIETPLSDLEGARLEKTLIDIVQKIEKELTLWDKVASATYALDQNRLNEFVAQDRVKPITKPTKHDLLADTRFSQNKKEEYVAQNIDSTKKIKRLVKEFFLALENFDATEIARVLSLTDDEAFSLMQLIEKSYQSRYITQVLSPEREIAEERQRRFTRNNVLLLYIKNDPVPTLVVEFDTSDRKILGRTSPYDSFVPDIDLSDFINEDDGVSRRHAELVCEEERLFIKDLHSVNRTYVNGDLVDPDDMRLLESGDVIRLGALVFSIRFDIYISGQE